MGTGLLIRSLESGICDQQRIIAADEAILEHEKDPERRKVFLDEIFQANEKIETLQRELLEFGAEVTSLPAPSSQSH
jgi:hypothetical protein